jgi:hypothetical protein
MLKERKGLSALAFGNLTIQMRSSSVGRSIFIVMHKDDGYILWNKFLFVGNSYGPRRCLVMIQPRGSPKGDYVVEESGSL